jgi:hypothetical protein
MATSFAKTFVRLDLLFKTLSNMIAHQKLWVAGNYLRRFINFERLGYVAVICPSASYWLIIPDSGRGFFRDIIYICATGKLGINMFDSMR